MNTSHGPTSHWSLIKIEQPIELFLDRTQLTQECVNTRMSVYGRGARGGHAAVEIMAGIGRACPRLR